MAAIRSRLRILTPLALLPLLAQCRSRTEIELPLPAGTSLVVHTAEPMIARGLLRALGGATDAALPAGHLRLSLQGDGRIAVDQAIDEAAWFRATFAPAPLRAQFRAEVDRVLPMLRGGLTVLLQGRGLQPRAIAVLVDEVLSWPEQVDAVAVRIDESPLQLGQSKKWSGYTLTIRPRAGTPLATRYAGLRPGLAAPPLLPGSGDAVASIRLSLHPDIARPLVEFLAQFAAGSRVAAEVSAAFAQRWQTASDGTLTLEVDPQLRVTGAFGLRDATAAAAAGAATRELLGAVAEQTDADFGPAAASHRAVELLRLHRALASPLLGKKEFELFAGTAGQWSLFTVGGDAGFATATIDDALDDRIRRGTMRQGVLLHARFDLSAVMELVPGMASAPRIGMPTRAAMTVTAETDVLRVEVRAD